MTNNELLERVNNKVNEFVRLLFLAKTDSKLYENKFT